jgi:hypothetical protein
MFIRPISTIALSCALAAPAFANDVGVRDEADVQTIVVTGQREEYGAVSTRSATRTETPLRNVPQAITVISESQIEDQALRSIADVLNYVPGATPGTGEGNRDQITLRGNNTTADFFIDGVRDDVQYFRDLYNAERIEILRGPNAMIFGRGGGGGVSTGSPSAPASPPIANSRSPPTAKAAIASPATSICRSLPPSACASTASMRTVKASAAASSLSVMPSTRWPGSRSERTPASIWATNSSTIAAPPTAACPPSAAAR